MRNTDNVTVRLMRHAEPNGALVDSDDWRGAANDLAPLTHLGVAQARIAADRLRENRPDVLLSSPMTRALQTAAIIGTVLDIEPCVDLNLREWLPDASYQWTSASEVQDAYESMLKNGGVRGGDDVLWEPLASVRSRALEGLRPHLSPGRRVIVVCHEVLIHALTGHQRTPHTGIRELADVC